MRDGQRKARPGSRALFSPSRSIGLAFAMVDPRSQGMAGVARFLQGLTGASDPACVDADAWNTMSEEERIARHTSAADVARIAIDHHCPLAPSQREPR